MMASEYFDKPMIDLNKTTSPITSLGTYEPVLYVANLTGFEGNDSKAGDS